MKPQMDMQSKEAAMQSSFKKKHRPLSKENNCKSTKIYKKSMYSDKNYQENEIINMQPVMPELNMWLSKPAIRRLCSDNNCQSTKCYKKMSPVRPMYSQDKNCRSANMM